MKQPANKTPKPKKIKCSNELCKKKFVPRTPKQHACCTKCRNLGYWQRHPERKVAPLHELIKQGEF
jgi:hypothetical protein